MRLLKPKDRSKEGPIKTFMKKTTYTKMVLLTLFSDAYIVILLHMYNTFRTFLASLYLSFLQLLFLNAGL